MTTEFIQLLLNALIGLLAGTVGGYYAARVQLKRTIAEDIRTTRKKAYKELWKISGQLPKYPPATEINIVTLGGLYDLSVAMAEWYFQSDGGMIMSNSTKRKYMQAQEKIEKFLLLCQQKELQRRDTGPPSHAAIRSEIDRQIIANCPFEKQDRDNIQQAFSALRTSMTNDLLSRSTLFF